MPQRFPITPIGYKKLEDELHKLKAVERPAIITAIAEARAHGDLSENAEYHAAKEKQGFVEAKIADLESKTSRAHIIEVSQIVSDIVQFGATVKVMDEENDKVIIYKIVSDYEANVAERHISISSPVARALLGKKAGDSIEVITPKGIKYYNIIEFSYI